MAKFLLKVLFLFISVLCLVHFNSQAQLIPVPIKPNLNVRNSIIVPKEILNNKALKLELESFKALQADYEKVDSSIRKGIEQIAGYDTEIRNLSTKDKNLKTKEDLEAEIALRDNKEVVERNNRLLVRENESRKELIDLDYPRYELLRVIQDEVAALDSLFEGQNFQNTNIVDFSSKQKEVYEVLDTIFNLRRSYYLFITQKEYVEKKKSLQNKLSTRGYNYITVDQYMVEFEMLENEEETRVKQIYDEYDGIIKNYVYKAKDTELWRLFPASNSVEAEIFYNTKLSKEKFSLLHNAQITLGQGGRGSIYTELFSDYFGMFRLSFGMQVASRIGRTETVSAPGGTLQINGTTNTANPTTINRLTERQKDAIQRMVGGGGNFTVALGLPWLRVHDHRSNFTLHSSFAPTVSFDIAGLSLDDADGALHGNIGLDLNFVYYGIKGGIALYGDTRMGYVVGDANFRKYLGLSTNFWLAHVGAGVGIGNKLRVGFRTFLGETFVNNNFPATLTFTILPGF